MFLHWKKKLLKKLKTLLHVIYHYCILQIVSRIEI